MLAESSVLGTPDDAAVAPDGEARPRGSNSGEDEKGRIEEGDRSIGGNRWPREETEALIKIRTEMDAAFRESSSKGPLWEEVARKLAELGCHRNAKKCKEKFENVYKYHKRTKEGRGGKPDSKTYKFFEQLEALESHHSSTPPPPNTAVAPLPTKANPPSVSLVTVPSATILPQIMSQNTIAPMQPINMSVPSFPPSKPTVVPPPAANPIQNVIDSLNPSGDFLPNSTSSSTSSDEELGRQRKRKRGWKSFFNRLVKEVVGRQEEMQKRFLEEIEKREQERVAREEAWRMQEMMKVNREREILAQERSMAAAKDAAVLAFLQKIADQQNVTLKQQSPDQQNASLKPQPPPPQAPPPLQLTPIPISSAPPMSAPSDNGGNNINFLPPSSSRWPKVEIEALIKLRTTLDAKYQDNTPKGPLWEEISTGMRRLGYNRSAKRCKEKWENINKYFKKVKESNKKRSEDSKTCPYFHQLDALYRERNKTEMTSSNPQPKNTVPLMVQPEQQWPPLQDNRPESGMHGVVAQQTDQNQEDRYREGDQEEDDDEDEDEDEGSDQYEIVANKPSSAA